MEWNIPSSTYGSLPASSTLIQNRLAAADKTGAYHTGRGSGWKSLGLQDCVIAMYHGRSALNVSTLGLRLPLQLLSHRPETYGP